MTACPLCGSTRATSIYDFRRESRPHAISGLVVRCDECGFWFKIPVASQSIRDAYGDDYAQDPDVAPYMSGTHARAFFRSVLDGLETRSGRLLDIGTGAGGFVAEAQSAGYAASGIDLCEPLVREAQRRGLDVQCRSAEEIDEAGAFDVITMLDVIEHVPDPLGLLRAAHRALRPGGELVVFTPNHRAAVVMMARLLAAMGRRGPVIEIFGGNHVGFFDDRTLPAALQRAHFSVSRMQRFPYDHARPGQHVSRTALAAVFLIEQAGRPFGRTFRMLTYGRSMHAD